MGITVEYCHNCGKQNDESYKFCIHCGVKLIKKSIKCVKCGKLNEYDSNFCIYCGNKLKNNPHTNEKFKEKIEDNNSSDLGVIYLGGTTIDNRKIEKNTQNTDSDNIKPKTTDNEQEISKNLHKKQDNTNIENNNAPEKKQNQNTKHTSKRIKKEQNTFSKNTKEITPETPPEVIHLPEAKTNNQDFNSETKLKENNNPHIHKEFKENVEFINYSDSEILTIIEKILDDSETEKDSNNIKPKTTDNKPKLNKNIHEKQDDTNIEHNNPHIHEKFEENVEFINYSDSEILTIIEKILDDSETEKDSNNIKPKTTDNKPKLDKNIHEKQENTNIKNHETPEKKEEPEKRFIQNKIKKEQNTFSETKESITETQSEVIHLPEAKTTKCNFCGRKILNDDPFKICKSCLIRISNHLDLLCEDSEINTKIPLKNIYRKAEEYKLRRKDIKDISTTLMKYKYLHKINGEILIDYNKELRNFIDKYSTKTVNKTKDIEKNVNLVTEKIGLNTPFNITYLKETLNFKNSEISKMIKYLDEKNAIIEEDDYYILVDKSN